MSGFPISAGTDPGQAARLLSTLSAGRALQAIVVGATRHGLVVRLDQQDLVLEKSPAFAAGTSLILKPEGKASEAGRQVQILAVNGQPLARPVTSALQPRPLSSTATPSDPGAALGDDTVTLSSSADRAARAEPPPASHAASGATRTMPPAAPSDLAPPSPANRAGADLPRRVDGGASPGPSTASAARPASNDAGQAGVAAAKTSASRPAPTADPAPPHGAARLATHSTVLITNAVTVGKPRLGDPSKPTDGGPSQNRATSAPLSARAAAATPTPRAGDAKAAVQGPASPAAAGGDGPAEAMPPADRPQPPVRSPAGSAASPPTADAKAVSTSNIEAAPARRPGPVPPARPQAASPAPGLPAEPRQAGPPPMAEGALEANPGEPGRAARDPGTGPASRTSNAAAATGHAAWTRPAGGKPAGEPQLANAGDAGGSARMARYDPGAAEQQAGKARPPVLPAPATPQPPATGRPLHGLGLSRPNATPNPDTGQPADGGTNRRPAMPEGQTRPDVAAGGARPEGARPLLGRLIQLLGMPENVSDSHPEFEPAAAGPSARAESPTRAVLPVANQTLAARLLGLMALAAMPRGDPGIDAQGQAPGARDPLASLLGDLAQAGQADAPDGWRTLALPLGQDPAQALWIHVRMEDQARRDGGDSPDRVEDRPRRALFDIDFSHLGRC
jgi:hypothetical protein